MTEKQKEKRAEEVSRLMMKLQEVSNDQSWLCGFLIDTSIKTLLEMGIPKSQVLEGLVATLKEKDFEVNGASQ